MADIPLPTIKRPNEEQQPYVPAETPMASLQKVMQGIASASTAPAAASTAPPRPAPTPLPVNSGRGDTSTPIGRFAEQYGPRIVSENGVDTIRMGAPAAPTPAPAALPQASYSNEGRTTNADIVMPKPAVAAPAPAPLPAMAPASRTPVHDPYSGPAAGMVNPNVTPTSGVEDGMRQLQNLRALSDMTPTGGFNTLTDHAAEINAANEKRSNLAAAIEGMNKAGTRTARAGFAAIANTMMAGENQALTTGMNNQVQLAGQANQAGIAAAGNQVQMRGQTLNNNLGMRQVGATERGQDKTAQTAGAQIAEQARGHDLQSAVGNRQVDATLQGQQTTAQTAEKNIQANIGIHQADAASREKTAEKQLGATVQGAELRQLPPNVFSMGGRYYQIDKKTKQPVPFGMPAP